MSGGRERDRMMVLGVAFTLLMAYVFNGGKALLLRLEESERVKEF